MRTVINLLKRLYQLVLFLLPLYPNAYADVADLLRLQKAYPQFIQAVTKDYLVWTDGTVMPVNSSLLDQVEGIHYLIGIPSDPANFNPSSDPGRFRYEPFFRKMYGNSEEEVKSKLVTIYWMPNVFAKKYPLHVTTINGVAQKLIKISNELEILVAKHPDYKIFLEHPGGTYSWRLVANTSRLSNHSFGMTIDINPATSDYWQWDLASRGLPIAEDTPLIYHNHVPWEIVSIFEKYGFIWGGKWYHYDSMHFEYRPELLIH